MTDHFLYSTTKAAVLKYTKHLPRDLRGIRANAIMPGWVDTPIYERAGVPRKMLEEVFQNALKTIPVGRIAKARGYRQRHPLSELREGIVRNRRNYRRRRRSTDERRLGVPGLKIARVGFLGLDFQPYTRSPHGIVLTGTVYCSLTGGNRPPFDNYHALEGAPLRNGTDNLSHLPYSRKMSGY